MLIYNDSPALMKPDMLTLKPEQILSLKPEMLAVSTVQPNHVSHTGSPTISTMGGITLLNDGITTSTYGGVPTSLGGVPTLTAMPGSLGTVPTSLPGVPTSLGVVPSSLGGGGVPNSLSVMPNSLGGVPATQGGSPNTSGQVVVGVNEQGQVITYVPYGIPVQAPVSPSQTMELVWHGEFDRLFAQYFPHGWYLVPTFAPPTDRWRVFKDSAKVRFSCQECGHGWTSMKGRVIFWFSLNYSTNSGVVMFKLYGQQCQKCKNGNFEHAMWYPEEVVKVIGNVYNRVGQIYYGFVRPPLRIDRRQGKPRNQHNAELCQACMEGLCKEEWSFS